MNLHLYWQTKQTVTLSLINNISFEIKLKVQLCKAALCKN